MLLVVLRPTHTAYCAVLKHATAMSSTVKVRVSFEPAVIDSGYAFCDLPKAYAADGGLRTHDTTAVTADPTIMSTML